MLSLYEVATYVSQLQFEDIVGFLNWVTLDLHALWGLWPRPLSIHGQLRVRNDF